MQPRFLGRLGLADLISVLNAVLGFLAILVAPIDASYAARLILLAAIADGLDGVVARVRGGTPVGEYLDSLSDVASFGIAPAIIVFIVAQEAGSIESLSIWAIFVVGIPVVYVGMAIIRLGFYMLYDRDVPQTEGVQTTLSAVLISVAYLAGIGDPMILLIGMAILTYLMVAPITYPELYARDAVILGGLQALVVIAPSALGRVFPRVLFVCALAYLVFGPLFYWRNT